MDIICLCRKIRKICENKKNAKRAEGILGKLAPCYGLVPFFTVVPPLWDENAHLLEKMAPRWCHLITRPYFLQKCCYFAMEILECTRSTFLDFSQVIIGSPTLFFIPPRGILLREHGITYLKGFSHWELFFNLNLSTCYNLNLCNVLPTFKRILCIRIFYLISFAFNYI